MSGKRSKAGRPRVKTGRPKLQINEQDLENLCNLNATKEEICDWFKISGSTLDERIKDLFGCTFQEYYNHNSTKGKISLRRKQFQVALNGDTKMLIWLGKQHLDQKEKTETRTDNINTNLNANANIDLSHLSDDELDSKLNQLKTINGQ